MSALVRVRVRFRTGLASEAYQPACTPPTVVRGRGARIGGPSDYCNLRSSSWAREAGRVGTDLEAPPHALQVGFDLAAHGLVLQPTLGDDLRGAVPHHPRAQSRWPRAMDVDGTRHGVRRRQVRRRRSHRLQPLKARLALGQCLLHRSKLAPPHGSLRGAHLLLAHMRPAPAFVCGRARRGRLRVVGGAEVVDVGGDRRSAWRRGQSTAAGGTGQAAAAERWWAGACSAQRCGSCCWALGEPLMGASLT